jgi:hypothetical protein
VWQKKWLFEKTLFEQLTPLSSERRDKKLGQTFLHITVLFNPVVFEEGRGVGSLQTPRKNKQFDTHINVHKIVTQKN